MARTKYYVVWEGRAPGIYDSWEEAEMQISGYPGAKFKAFPDQESATAAFRGRPGDQMALFRAMAAHNVPIVDYSNHPDIHLNAIAVDGACAKNPGPMEYRGVLVANGQQVFHVGPIDGGTNNIAEYLALIHAAALLRQRGDSTTPIYSDSRTALAWLRAGHSRTTVTPDARGRNARTLDLLRRADAWLAANAPIVNPILKWNTDSWGEIPADFGRK